MIAAGYEDVGEGIMIKPANAMDYRTLLVKVLVKGGSMLLNDYSVARNRLWDHGEIQLSIPVFFAMNTFVE